MERKMGIASLILGVFSFILGMIPVFGCCMTAPAAIGLVLGLVSSIALKSRNYPAVSLDRGDFKRDSPIDYFPDIFCDSVYRRAHGRIIHGENDSKKQKKDLKNGRNNSPCNPGCDY